MKSTPRTMFCVQNAACSVSAKKLSTRRSRTRRPMRCTGTSSSGISFRTSQRRPSCWSRLSAWHRPCLAAGISRSACVTPGPPSPSWPSPFVSPPVARPPSLPPSRRRPVRQPFPRERRREESTPILTTVAPAEAIVNALQAKLAELSVGLPTILADAREQRAHVDIVEPQLLRAPDAGCGGSVASWVWWSATMWCYPARRPVSRSCSLTGLVATSTCGPRLRRHSSIAIGWSCSIMSAPVDQMCGRTTPRNIRHLPGTQQTSSRWCERSISRT